MILLTDGLVRIYNSFDEMDNAKMKIFESENQAAELIQSHEVKFHETEICKIYYF